MGYYDNSIPESQLDHLQHKVEKLPRVVRSLIRDQGLEKYHDVEEQLPPLRKRVGVCGQWLNGLCLLLSTFTSVMSPANKYRAVLW